MEVDAVSLMAEEIHFDRLISSPLAAHTPLDFVHVSVGPMRAAGATRGLLCKNPPAVKMLCVSHGPSPSLLSEPLAAVGWPHSLVGALLRARDPLHLHITAFRAALLVDLAAPAGPRALGGSVSHLSHLGPRTRLVSEWVFQG